MSFPRYPAYKDSGVEWLGEVPEQWRLLSLKHVASLNPTKANFNGSLDEVYSFVPMEKLKTGRIILDEVRPAEDVLGGYTYFEEGDVLQAKVTPCFENKNIALARGLTNGVGFGSTEINVLRSGRDLKPEFLYYRVQEDGYMSVCTSSMIGAGGLKRVPPEVINTFKIALPPLQEQTQIARFLDHETAKIDALIQEQQRLIELLKEKRQAVISHAVTKGLDPSVPMKDSGVEWLGEVPEHWRVSQLKFNTLLMQTGPFGSQLHAEDYIQDGVPLVNPAHMKDGKIIPDSQASVDQDTWHRLERHQLSPGELVFARRGELGRCAVVTEAQKGWLCGTGSLKAKLNAKLLPEYAYLLVTSKGVVSELSLESKGSTMENLNTETLGRVRLPLPPPPEQKQILDYVARLSGSFGSLIQEAQAAIEIISERRSALISAAVTGKIDVRNWKPPADETAFDEEVRQAGLEVVS
ncbi:restriction endonuclease subunit S [Sediminihaliea albiluteola]|uniref:restriction endonuclease subunit S n=1 Tax=Sediminihaliea albiluteola TaxID=2758564 RepID=UPI001C70E9E8|nr:restriction endonuclease subunit S [Sediminihaliea albiluteola]